MSFGKSYLLECVCVQRKFRRISHPRWRAFNLLNRANFVSPTDGVITATLGGHFRSSPTYSGPANRDREGVDMGVRPTKGDKFPPTNTVASITCGASSTERTTY